MARRQSTKIDVSLEFKKMLDDLTVETERARGIRPSRSEITAELAKKQFDKFARRVLFG